MSIPASASNLLSVSDLSVEFRMPAGAFRALERVSFRVPRGRTVALVGESGSGKTVIAQTIMGLLPANGEITSGQLLFDHDKSAQTPPRDIARLARSDRGLRALQGRHMGMVFQEPMSALSPLHTIGDQVSESARFHLRLSGAAARALTIDTLRLVGFPDPDRAWQAYPFELSGGLRQRAVIAMAIICRPALLIADEPTTALDVTIQAQILALLQRLQDELDMAVLLITHDLGVVAHLADEIVVLHQGQVMEAGDRRAIFSAPAHPYLRALLDAVPRLVPSPSSSLSGAGDDPAGVAARADLKKSDPDIILSVQGVYKGFQSRAASRARAGGAAPIAAVADVSFDLYRGECVGLVGESGCGKTTTARLIMRALMPDAGEIRFRGTDIATFQGRALSDYRTRVQYIFQDPFSSLNPRMTIGDLLCEPLQIHGRGNRASRRARARMLMQRVGLDPDHLARYPHAFSGGQRQRIGIARALALDPELLICDEPVSALDVSVQARILALLKDLQAELSLTYLFVSHDLAVVRQIADRVIVMHRGRVVETGGCDELFRNPIHPYTRALLAAVPDPNPDTPFDFAAAMASAAGGTDGWPVPFRETGTLPARMKPVSPTHFVRVFDAHAA